MKKLDIHGVGMTSQRTRDRLAERLREKGIHNQDVLNVMRKVPRHLFTDPALATRAYEDTALPIGHKQTISQPFIVARMTELILAESTPGKALEIGTGSGYQAAVLGAFVKELHTVEIVEPLYRRARDLLYQLGYRNIRTHKGDGNLGWTNAAPYDAIIVTAAPDRVPQQLLEQLDINGRLVIPVGQQQTPQQLQVITRLDEKNWDTKHHEFVQFVPLV